MGVVHLGKSIERAIEPNGSVFQRHILTAAHCCDNHEARELRVVAGEHDLNSEDGLEQAARVDAIRMHERYDRDTIENDLCILTLREELQFDRFVQRIPPTHL